MKKIISTLSMIVLTSFVSVYAQEKCFMVGHSLINFTMPRMLEAIAESKDQINYDYDLQITNGSSLKNNWLNSDKAQGSNSKVELPKGIFENLILTEAVPLHNHLTWSNSYEMARNFANLGFSGNDSIQTYIFETWHCINSGTPIGCPYDNNDHLPWRERLDSDLIFWEGIADSVNLDSKGKQSLIIPGGQSLKAVYDSIGTGYLNELDSVQQLFEDHIHMTDLGNYFIACVLYATVFEESPVGATNSIKNEWGEDFDLPVSTTLYNKLQTIAWEVVSSYPRSGVILEETSIDDNTQNEKIYKLQVIENQLLFANVKSAALYDLKGRKIKTFIRPRVFETSHLQNGIYVLRINGLHVEKIVIQN